MDTCRGHYNNVSCVLFHPRQELILSKLKQMIFFLTEDVSKINSLLFALFFIVGKVILSEKSTLQRDDQSVTLRCLLRSLCRFLVVMLFL